MSNGRFNDALVAKGQEVLDEMRYASSALVQAVLLSDDGFEMSRTPRLGESDGRFASMASSVQALSEAVIHELRIGTGDAMIIQASQGVVIQSRIGSHPAVISALFRTGESLGQCLVVTRRATAALEDALARGVVSLQG